MKNISMSSVVKLLAGATLLVAAPMVLAGGSPQVDWSVTVGSGGYPAPRVYSPPQAVYVQPQPVYVQPRPVYVQPRPVYVPPPMYVQPAAVVQYGTPYYGHKHHKHHWKHHHRHHHD